MENTVKPKLDIFIDRREVATILGFSIGTYVTPKFDDEEEGDEGGTENGEQVFIGFMPNDLLDEYIPDEWLENIAKWNQDMKDELNPTWFLKLNHLTGGIKLINYETGEDEESFEEEIDGEVFPWLEILKRSEEGALKININEEDE